MFIYDMPYNVHSTLCKLLNVDDDWKELGGSINMETLDIQLLERSKNPAELLLSRWGRSNATVDMLVDHLYNIKNYRAVKYLEANLDIKKKNRPNVSQVPVKEQLEEHIPKKTNISTVRNFAALPTPPPSYMSKCQSTESESSINDSFNFQESNSADNLDSFSSLNIDISDNKAKFKKNHEIVFTSSSSSLKCNEKCLNDSINEDVSKNKEISFASSNSNGCAIKLPTYYPFDELVTSTYAQTTNNFFTNFNKENLIGSGGFADIYKGHLRNSDCAIKVFNKRIEEDKYSSFNLEINSLLKYKHENIIKLLGGSIDGPFKCIVYEFMVNGSLLDRLSCKDNTKSLHWFVRHNILFDVISGLKYLHTTWEKPLIHGDIKSANILLDAMMIAKIGDFGLSNEATGGSEKGVYTRVSNYNITNFATMAYMPFEFCETSKLTLATDVHALGIIILETVTGRKPIDENRILLRKLVEESDKMAQTLKDTKCNDWPDNFCQKIIDLGVKCISFKKEDRPKTVEIFDTMKMIMLDIEDANCTTLASTHQNEQQSSIKSNSLKSFSELNDSDLYGINFSLPISLPNQKPLTNEKDDCKLILSNDFIEESADHEDLNNFLNIENFSSNYGDDLINKIIKKDISGL